MSTFNNIIKRNKFKQFLMESEYYTEIDLSSQIGLQVHKSRLKENFHGQYPLIISLGNRTYRRYYRLRERVYYIPFYINNRKLLILDNNYEIM